MEFTANSATLTKDEYSTLLAFADNAHDPQCYVCMDITNSPTEQDIKLGMGAFTRWESPPYFDHIRENIYR